MGDLMGEEGGELEHPRAPLAGGDADFAAALDGDVAQRVVGRQLHH